MNQMTYILFVIPWFLLTIGLEYLIGRRHPGRAGRGYEKKDAAASISMGLANLTITFFVKALTLGFFLWVYEHRVLDLGETVWAWPALILAEDFCYYWFHRVHHECRFFWAAHVNHHSSTHYNLSTALRQSWTTPITGPIFWAPLALAGFHPAMIFVAQAVSLVYQYWLHTELIVRLGPLEWIINTPSHHRVHHGRNTEYLDKNYGGILIIWDRLFGSFEPEVAAVDYGLTKNLATFNPLKIAFHEFVAMFRDAAAAPGLFPRLGYLVRAPGWRHDGTGATVKELRLSRTRAGSPTLDRVSRGAGTPSPSE